MKNKKIIKLIDYLIEDGEELLGTYNKRENPDAFHYAQGRVGGLGALKGALKAEIKREKEIRNNLI